MRTVNTIKNILFSTGGMVITQLLSFVSRTIFIQVLGVEYLGINGLFANILMMLSLGELGVGQAITFSLYKPLSENNTDKVNSLMQLYKKIYRFIGIGVLIIGVALLPLLPLITKGAENVDNLYVIYLIFLFTSSFSYFWGYKRTLIIADQKAYKIVPFTTVSLLISISLQIAVLLLTENYILYLLIILGVKLVENVVINRFIDRKYPYLKSVAQPIGTEDKSVIVKNIKAMLFHKVGDVSINGTDNIIISAFVGVAAVGIYSNYLMITLIIKKFLLLIFNGAGASLGNLIARARSERKEEVFRTLNFLAFILFGGASIFIYFTLSLFIDIWIGESYMFSNLILLVLSTNFFLVGMGAPLRIVKSAAGVYNEDKYAAIVQSLINLLVSIIGVHFWGTLGVVLGTFVAIVAVPLWNRPYIVYKYVFEMTPNNYFIKLLMYSSAVVISGVLIHITINSYWFISTSDTINILYRVIIALIIPTIVFFLLFYKTVEFTMLRKYIQLNKKWMADETN